MPKKTIRRSDMTRRKLRRVAADMAAGRVFWVWGEPTHSTPLDDVRFVIKQMRKLSWTVGPDIVLPDWFREMFDYDPLTDPSREKLFVGDADDGTSATNY